MKGNEISFRQKRDLTSNNSSNSTSSKPRIRKKLIRIEPIYHNNNTNVTKKKVENVKIRRRMRRKLKIKKKKRIIPTSTTTPSSSQTRRRIIVTKKRLLSTSSSILRTLTDDFILPSSTSSSIETLTETTEEESSTEPYEEEDYDDTEYDEEIEEEENDEDEYIQNEDKIQHVPDYEPFFPELSETFEAPVLLLKTTVLTSTELQTKTVVQSRLRTYTFLITRVSGTEKIVTSTTELKPHIKTTTITDTLTKLTTLTLLDFDATTTNKMTILPSTGSYQQFNDPEDSGKNHFDEARNYLATRVMSNGVEVIVAGDKSTLPGEPDVKRVLPSSIFKPITLKPSTLSEHMMMLMPSDASKINGITSSLYPNNKFVTKTCLTTFTYLTTYLESGTTTVSSHEQVVSNIATEERNTGKILPTPSMGITLTQYPSLSVGVFYTTYTYLNTIVDGDQPLVITSKHTVTNTVTAPDDYLSLIQQSEKAAPQKDTNTYYSTIMLTKTIKDDDTTKVISTKEKLTQIVITESIPPKATSVMTSYIALDVEDPEPEVTLTTTDVVRTYFITYTYFNTLVENGKTTVHTNISTSADVTTEKLYLHPKRSSSSISSSAVDLSPENVVIVATKTYQTTFTYFTTLLQEDNTATPTVVSSHSRVVENIATETIHPKQLNERYWKMLKNELEHAQNQVRETVLLNDGQKLEVTAYKKTITPTKVLPIEVTKVPKPSDSNSINLESSNPNVVTGSTIIFFDDEPSSSSKPTPSLKNKNSISNKNTASINSEVIKKTQIITSSSKVKKSKTQNVKPTKPNTSTRPTKNNKNDKTKNKQVTKLPKPNVENVVSSGGDLLGLGSINIESLKALTPVINAMAGLIKTNLKSNRKENETSGLKSQTLNKNNFHTYQNDTQNRSPIYIPVGDLEVSESQNIGTYQQHIQDKGNWDGNNVYLKKPTHETPLLNGGIPISPGEVITANSDVIVGKPGRILPRIPAIPLNQNQITERNPWGSNNPKPIPLGAHSENTPSIVHAPNKDDYVGPPPPISNKLNRGEKHKHIPIHYNEGTRRPERPHLHIPLQNYGHHQHNYAEKVNYYDNEIKLPTQPLQVEIQKKYEQISKDNVPIYAQAHASPVIHNANIQPSIIREPMILPEVIERSTGQPLLVNIQPSQVAFVNIPHNRTTALIYGGSTEPHKNGQYFDDPSPYSESEYPNIENYNNVVRYTADFNVHQKQVKGVIKVVPDSSNSRIEHISPSKPHDLFVNANNHEVNVQVPPISFGMFQSGNDFNAHVINHGPEGEGIRFQLPPVAYEVVKTQNINVGSEYNSKKPENRYQPQQEHNNNNKQNHYKHIQKDAPNIVHSSNQIIEETMAQRRPEGNNRVQLNNQQSSTLIDYMIPPTYRPTLYTPKRPQRPQRKPVAPHHGQKFQTQQHGYTTIPTSDNDFGLINSEGEFIQESNIRPLRVGEVPSEIKYKTTPPPPRKNNTHHTHNTELKSHYENEVNHLKPPVIADPRPFVRPENYQTNQIVNTNNGIIFKGNSFNQTSIRDLLRKEVVISSKPRDSITSPSNNAEVSINSNGRIESVTVQNRPRVTSLPINSNVIHSEKHHTSSQTEEPFQKTHPNYEINKVVVPHLNTGEIINSNTSEASLEIMRPPSPTPYSYKKPALTLKPPEVTNTPALFNENVDIKQPKPFVPKPAENMMPPPPKIVSNEEVLGMSPPPITTYRPIRAKVTTPKSREYYTTTSKPTQRIRTRRPLPTRRTTTIPRKPTSYRPVFHVNRTRTTSPPRYTYPRVEIEKSTTNSPKLEIITGEQSNTNHYIDSAKKNPSGFKLNIDLSKKDIIASSVHHAGNEVRVIDENTRSTPVLTSVKLLPTRFITHTHTSTVTITKTTVVKTPGGPPSTSTLLVTKTEKSTIIDTVTEFHTLVKPTSIIETITTTVQTGSLYPSNAYGSPYPSIQLRPTKTIIGHVVTPSTMEHVQHVDEDLDEFIITDTDPPNTSNESKVSMQDNDTIFVVMTDKNHGSIVKIPPEETQNRDEMLSSNKVNDVLIAGVLSANPPSIDTDFKPSGDKCYPECKASRNELCQKTAGIMRCVCRPGFARMFPDRPCNPTYTYSLEIELERFAKKKLTYNENLGNPNSSEYLRMAATTHEALDRMVMQSDLRDVYHGVHLSLFKPGKTGIINSFYLQLSDNTDEKRLEDVFKKYLRGNNFSLGGTELFASKESQQSLTATDFDECHNIKFHDCSDNAQCFNLRGTYTCSCKEGFSDLSENILYPGRICSAELVGCEKCNYHGTCYSRGDDQVICECFQWYSGETCYFNLKVLLIALVSLGTILFVLLLICCIVTCSKRRPSPKMNTGLSFFPQRIPHPVNRSTLDRRAMIADTSSEDSRSETNSLPYVTEQKSKKPKSVLKKTSLPRKYEVEHNATMDQKDRSLTVMIPRAKYHPAPPAPNMSSYTTFDASKVSISNNKPQNNEAKLLSYLDAGPSPLKMESKRKYSSQVSESYIDDDEPISRKTSGALISAGFEVSATVGNNMGTLGTTCGTEADRSENATLIQKISADLLSCTTRSQTNTLRNFEDDDMSNWMEIEPRIMTISETRSYDEASIPPPMKILRQDYDSKTSVHSHSHHHDEVAERDLGSTFLLPHTHLYKPDRESDISGFESL